MTRKKMKIATVKWFSDIKNFGFITTENGDDLFLHRNGLINPQGSPPSLLTGDKVSYEITIHQGRECAVDVERIPEEDDEEEE